ncbi:MAG TPA: DNA polymerase III subunit gamma/tau, partial [Hyphomonadaceae bacterium]|nr:DNA polymerase III subunit gamma/tau [Hyphomonadaceae bacterium]
GPSLDMAPPGRHCEAIINSRHPDVLELDAASRTGVDDMRELLDGARYTPVSARYKVFIIDEVHMLSKSAFNALLKTLEEP